MAYNCKIEYGNIDVDFKCFVKENFGWMNVNLRVNIEYYLLIFYYFLVYHYF